MTRWSNLLALLVATAITTIAAAQDVPTVQVGKDTKKTIGVVTAAQAGDVACYLSLKDDRGVAFRELADFELCEKKPSLVGKRVTLKYAIEKVMSDECQGDTSCKKTRNVAMVTTAQVIDSAAQVKSPANATSATAKASSQQTSFCTPMETVVFACRSGAKLISVCASKDASKRKGSLQYRFGKPDSAEPMEMTLPEGEPLPAKSASGENVPFAGGGGSWLRFSKGAFGYVVYSGIGKWGPKGETREKNGLVVERAGKTIAHLKCSGAASSELGPEWFDKLGIQANNQDFLFPD